jgi:hypothetical protein
VTVSANNHLSEASGINLQVGIKHFARAAACEELLADGSHTENMLWFIVRSMCNECGHNFNSVKDAARRYAQQVYANNINII